MKVFRGLALVVMLASPLTANAVNSVLSDMFDGSEPRLDPVPGSCLGQTRQLAYQDTGSFRVAASGTYRVYDVYQEYEGFVTGLQVTALIYDGNFDAQNPLNNLITQPGIAFEATVELFAGREYRLVVQQWCENQEGAWAIAFSGPGHVNSAVSRNFALETQGLITSEDPRVDTDCGASLRYRQSGPVQVQQGGTYYYYDVFTFYDVDACLQIYTEPFDPVNPGANRVGEEMDDFGTVELQPGQDYYFVVQALEFGPDTGEYFYVLAPPAPFRINKALAGGWFNSEVSGQGFLLDVYENINFMFLAWFTFDATRPDPGVPSTVGEAGQRWLTAQGVYQGDSASLDLFNAQDMIFNSPTPPVNNVPDGSLDIEFANCTEGTIRYDIPSSGLSGTIPIEPLVGPDIDSSTLELCESFTSRPGVPGPL